MFADARDAPVEMQSEEQSGQDTRGPRSGSEKVVFELGSCSGGGDLVGDVIPFSDFAVPPSPRYIPLSRQLRQ